jgi:hypothetical protein
MEKRQANHPPNYETQNIILKQNYFSFHDQIYQPDKGVAMGSPVSGIMAKVFFQHLEETIIKHLLDTKILSFYTRYIDIHSLFMTPHAQTRTTYCNILTQSAETSNLALPLNPIIVSNSLTCK